GFNALLRGLALQEDSVLRQDLRSQLPQRRDVIHDPNAAAMRGDDQIGLTRMHHNIAHGDVGELATFVLGPLLATIERNPQTKLGAGKEQVWRYRVFFYDVRVAADALSLTKHRRPGLAIVGGLVDIR